MGYVVEDMETGKKVYVSDREEAEKVFAGFCLSGNDTRMSQVNDKTESWIKIYYGGKRR